ncbi:MAG: dihydroxyacetone kinase subunit DhaL [Methylococcales bacterium]|nr:dihydroxyacetone kinase subunit DhaL [Methylococcales bacterium]
MTLTPEILPALIRAIVTVIETHKDEVTALDQAIGDGDHVINLQRGLNALTKQHAELANLSWEVAFQTIGMTLLSTMGGASGSLFGTLFLTMNKASKGKDLDLKTFAVVFTTAVDAVKKRGKAEAAEKTMLDVLIPVEQRLHQELTDNASLEKMLNTLSETAITGMEATRDMIATKGRASFMAERSQGHIDAGARTSQLMICAIIDTLKPMQIS